VYCGRPGLDEIARLPLMRVTLSESLRLYPQPPILIRRALEDDVLPAGLVSSLAEIVEGCTFLSYSYPQPPILIRRALEDDVLPAGPVSSSCTILQRCKFNYTLLIPAAAHPHPPRAGG